MYTIYPMDFILNSTCKLLTLMLQVSCISFLTYNLCLLCNFRTAFGLNNTKNPLCPSFYINSKQNIWFLFVCSAFGDTDSNAQRLPLALLSSNTLLVHVEPYQMVWIKSVSDACKANSLLAMTLLCQSSAYLCLWYFNILYTHVYVHIPWIKSTFWNTL